MNANMHYASLLLLLFLVPAGEPAPSRYEFEQVEMAVSMRLVLFAPDSEMAGKAAKVAFARIHDLNAIMSDYDETSELRRLCETAGKGVAVKVSDDLWRVLLRAQEISQRSEGAFDVTVGPVVRLWRQARRLQQLPSSDHLREARELVDYRNVRLDPLNRTVELLKPGMRLDLGGIAKGYAAAEALAVLKAKGISRVMVEAGGDMALGEPPPDRPGWRIGIAPADPQSPPRFYLWLSNTAVSTSGDMVQFVEIDGKRYSHVVDPRTGLGLTDRCHATVIHPDGMTADALSKAVGVLGPEKGIRLIDETPGAAALIIRSSEGKPETTESRRWKEIRGQGSESEKGTVPFSRDDGSPRCPTAKIGTVP
jgi:FAD:protein FMN transferase